MRKQKIPTYHVFRRYRLKTIYSGTNFFDFQIILSITAQSIFAVEPSGRARWKVFLIEIIENISRKKQHQQ
jgi:hypothetical protein